MTQNNTAREQILIGLTGAKRAGKDTVASILRSMAETRVPPLTTERLAFADPLKLEVAETLVLEDKQDVLREFCTITSRDYCITKARGCGYTVESLLRQFEHDKESWRDILQDWGTEFRRNHYGQDYWVLRMQDSLRLCSANLITITDVRFSDEAEFIRRNSGVLIRIERSGLPTDNRSNHCSETSMKNVPIDYIVHNYNGVDRLYRHVKALAVELGIVEEPNPTKSPYVS